MNWSARNSRRHQVEALVDVNGTPVHLSRLEFEVLVLDGRSA